MQISYREMFFLALAYWLLLIVGGKLFDLATSAIFTSWLRMPETVGKWLNLLCLVIVGSIAAFAYFCWINYRRRRDSD